MSHRLFQRARGWTILLAIVLAGALAALALDLRPGGLGLTRRLFGAGQHRADADTVARARAFLQRGQFRRAIQTVSSVREGSPSEGEALAVRGLALAALEDVGMARQVLERALVVRPDPMAAKVLAAVYMGAYETERALAVLKLAARIDPEDFRPWYAMGEGVYLRLRRYDEAAGAFREALKRRPDHVESQIGLVEALLKSHHTDEAGPLMRPLVRERSSDLKVLLLAAELALESGQMPEATRHVEQILTQDPEHREALLLRARLRFGGGRPRDAVSDAERASVMDPNDLGALNLLGSIQKALGLTEPAARTLARRKEVEERTARMEELIRQLGEKPGDPEPRWRLGRLAVEAGMKPLAVQSYQAALALAPDCEPARAGLRELGVAK
jgi:tetratricopeptide (TPR) repeat protein